MRVEETRQLVAGSGEDTRGAHVEVIAVEESITLRIRAV